MKKILGLVVLSLFAISASAADLMASSAAPTVTQNIVVEGAACPGVGATGFSSTGLLLSCQSGVWSRQRIETLQVSANIPLGSADYWRACPTGYHVTSSIAVTNTGGTVCGTQVINGIDRGYSHMPGGCGFDGVASYWTHTLTCTRIY